MAMLDELGEYFHDYLSALLHLKHEKVAMSMIIDIHEDDPLHENVVAHATYTVIRAQKNVDIAMEELNTALCRFSKML